MGDSVLGPIKGRVKTDLRVPKDLAKAVDKFAKALGVPKNAFYTLAAGFLSVRLAQMGAPGRSRENLLDAIEGEMRSLIAEARKPSAEV